jgi:hypothetical protein
LKTSQVVDTEGAKLRRQIQERKKKLAEQEAREDALLNIVHK